ncbi:MAG: glutamate-1-semialdehyde 2,1-aminomutase [Aquificae bacterium]|nr:glutamate-1-semialdehyde 2,1-aminomutase [Aquificota bacterium]
MTQSGRIFERALRVLPGGVNSPVRAFKAVKTSPIVAKRGFGPYLEDADGNRYVDFLMSWGPLILGHSHPRVVSAVKEAAEKGLSFGLTNPYEVELAEEVVAAVPSAQKVRFVNSGTEAVMSALRLARAATGRKYLVKFAGCYHGHYDAVLVSAGSGVATFGLPGTPGIPEEVARLTFVLPYNDAEAVRNLFAQRGEEIAAVIVEPVAGNMGVVPPEEEFLKTLREETKKHGALLIFDEVITGFRLSLGGAQEVFGIEPDLTTLGKVVGGGMPVGAYAGRRELMERIAPEGDVYQAGTLSGNPVAMAAGLATLRELKEKNPYRELEEKTASFVRELSNLLTERGIAHTYNRVGSMFTVFFTDRPVRNYDDAQTSDLELFARFFGALLKNGVLIPPSQFEAWFLSTAHDEKVLEEALEGIKRAIGEL